VAIPGPTGRWHSFARNSGPAAPAAQIPPPLQELERMHREGWQASFDNLDRVFAARWE